MILALAYTVGAFFIGRWARRRYGNDWWRVLVLLVALGCVIWFVSIAVLAANFCVGGPRYCD